MPDSPYSKLNAKLKHKQLIGSVSSLLGWDEQVLLPTGSQQNRQDQSAAMAKVAHEAATDPEIGRLLKELEATALDDDQRVTVTEARKDYDRATKLPAELVERHVRLCSEAYHTWAKAKKDNDYAAFALYIDKHVALAKECATCLGWGDRPYDYQIDLHDPGIDAATIETLFDELKQGLKSLAQRILESPTKANTDIFKGFPVDKQEAFLREVTASLGFDYSRGRLDTSMHPFCSGNGADIRMTTRFDKDNPLDSLFSSIHETGHGMYEQGLPSDQLHTALGQAAGMGVHESQSRLWENQVARSRAFWKHYEPQFRAAFSEQLKDIDSDTLYLAINAVGKTPIRVDADEVTYNFHIIIRFEIEKRLFSGELTAKDLPEYWNSQYEELIGIRPKSDAEGVLQDIHWSWGSFGYFPSYCLGNMLAAQLWYAAKDALPDIEEDFSKGEFSRLLTWLRQNIHEKGKRQYLLELSKSATSQPLSPKSLIRYIEERYLPLYT